MVTERRDRREKRPSPGQAEGTRVGEGVRGEKK